MCGAGSMWECSVLLAQFCCEPKAAKTTHRLTGKEHQIKKDGLEECDVTMLIGAGRGCLQSPTVL